MRILLDTGPVVALLDQRDHRHSWCVEAARDLAPPLFTCEAVLTEAHFLVSGMRLGTRRLIDLISSSRIICQSIASENLDRVSELMLRYANVPMSFANACLVAMAEYEPSTVFTLDRGFRIYRKNRSKRLRLLLP
ncbi:MAG: PIN domain-containing protein [Bacteroidetes bacterium]|nr:PIN domain-containing protein [Bacteroidota bacterium]